MILISRFFSLIFGLLFMLLLGAFIALCTFLSSINTQNLDAFSPALTSQIYAANGDLIANVYEEHRFYVKYPDIPARVIEALLAIEDTSFFEHDGINFDAIIRAIIKDIKTRSLAQGASTLTQQLVKNTKLSREKKFTRKLKELILSFQLELLLSKEEILERYLNYVFFGHGYYGIKTAALGYFHKELHELSLKEIAMLVGLPKAPSSYDPSRRLDLNLARANRVLSRMRALGWIDEALYQKSLKERPYVYNDTLSQNKAPYIVDEVLKQVQAMGITDFKTGGYKVHTTIDLKAQKQAQDAIKFGQEAAIARDSEIDLDQINGAMVVIKPQSGEIIALVGGADYELSNFNRATQSIRQLGSSFKPILYQIALNQGFSPASKVADIARVFEKIGQGGRDWAPKNYGSDFKGLITIKDALIKSRNLATLNLFLELDQEDFNRQIELFGFKEPPQGLAAALGSFGVSPYDFAGIYTSIANYGTRQEPLLIKRIEKGDSAKDFISQSHFAFAPEQAYLMIDMMRAVVTSGTGANARVAGIEVAGKTGTSNNSRDAWFIGFTPDILAITWFGNDNNLPMKGSEGGARTAAPVFRMFLSAYLEDNPDMKRSFASPKGVSSASLEGRLWFQTSSSPLPKKNARSLLEQQEAEGLMF